MILQSIVKTNKDLFNLFLFGFSNTQQKSQLKDTIDVEEPLTFSVYTLSLLTFFFQRTYYSLRRLCYKVEILLTAKEVEEKECLFDVKGVLDILIR